MCVYANSRDKVDEWHTSFPSFFQLLDHEDSTHWLGFLFFVTHLCHVILMTGENQWWQLHFLFSNQNPPIFIFRHFTAAIIAEFILIIINNLVHCCLLHTHTQRKYSECCQTNCVLIQKGTQCAVKHFNYTHIPSLSPTWPDRADKEQHPWLGRYSVTMATRRRQDPEPAEPADRRSSHRNSPGLMPLSRGFWL